MKGCPCLEVREETRLLPCNVLAVQHTKLISPMAAAALTG
jgi:hypothetical protein